MITHTPLNTDNADNTTRHILWLRTDSIGDNVLAASMLEYIASKFQSAMITVVCQEHIAELYATCPYVAHVITFNKALAYTDAHYREVIIRRLQALDVDIAMNSVFSRELIGDIFTTRCGARQRVGFLGDLCNIDQRHRASNNCYYTALLPSSAQHMPEIDRHADFLRYFGIVPKGRLHPAVWTIPEDERFAEEFFDRHYLESSHTLVVAPGSQNDYKIYPRFSEVLKEFTNFRLIIIGGMDTVAVSGMIYEKFKGTCHNLTGKLTLRQTAAIIRRSRLCLSSDSAAAHIAAAVGTRNVVALGGGHFGRFFPYSNLTTAVSLPLECYRCDWRCRFNERFCITAIAPELIVRAVQLSLDSPAEKPQLIAQGSALWTMPLPRWQGTYEFIDTDIVAVEIYNAIPKTTVRQQLQANPPLKAAIGTNSAISAIVESLKGASSPEETLSLYESYLKFIPYDLNVAKTAEALRLDILRQRLPRISIVTPSYNQAEYLEECILSIVTQGYPNLEYIVMDGGSSDNSIDIIKKYEKHIAYSKSAPDGGQYAAIDEGLKRSTGQIMGWLNSDDKLHAGALWVVAMLFSAYSEIQWIMGRPTVWDADGKLTAALTPIPLWSRKQYLDGFIGPPHIQQESTFWRRQLWDAAGGYIDTSLRYAGDMELWARFFRSAQCYSVEALIGGIRNHPQQKTAKPASDGSGYYDYGDYNSEAGAIIAREVTLYNRSPEQLNPPPPPVNPAQAALAAASSRSIIPENFSLFTYSKLYHRAYFNNTLPETIASYRNLLVAAFAAANLPQGSRVVISIAVPSDNLLSELSQKYEVWVPVGNRNTHSPNSSLYCIEGEITTSNSSLPLSYFDMAVVLQPSEEACNHVELLIKTGGLALFFFDAAISGNDVSLSAVLRHCMAKPHTTHPYVETSCLLLDPGALSFDGEKGTRQLSYNVLWKKTACEPGQASQAGETETVVPSSRPKVSVIVLGNPMPNIESLAHQTLPIELIIVDTTAADNGSDAIKKVLSIVKDTVLVYVPEGYSPASMANAALRVASGEFIVHLPKDSALAGNALEVMAAALTEYPEAALVYGDTYITLGAGETFEFHNCCRGIQNPDATHERLLVDSTLGPQPMWRKAVHNGIGYIDESVQHWLQRFIWLKLGPRHQIMHIPVFTG
ncbi:MAG: glycosyltransferase, partial [Nitrospirae bacterium]|nr:glycosyltransferase [Nitrospirota bacterium]